uniref:Uncharacterized protein n=1 Tax=Arundo donax TaxID=35708 RepID=A0A0A8Z1B1_ARUDO
MEMLEWGGYNGIGFFVVVDLMFSYLLRTSVHLHIYAHTCIHTYPRYLY